MGSVGEVLRCDQHEATRSFRVKIKDKEQVTNNKHNNTNKEQKQRTTRTQNTIKNKEKQVQETKPENKRQDR